MDFTVVDSTSQDDSGKEGDGEQMEVKQSTNEEDSEKGAQDSDEIDQSGTCIMNTTNCTCTVQYICIGWIYNVL